MFLKRFKICPGNSSKQAKPQLFMRKRGIIFQTNPIITSLAARSELASDEDFKMISTTKSQALGSEKKSGVIITRSSPVYPLQFTGDFDVIPLFIR